MVAPGVAHQISACSSALKGDRVKRVGECLSQTPPSGGSAVSGIPLCGVKLLHRTQRHASDFLGTRLGGLSRVLSGVLHRLLPTA